MTTKRKNSTYTDEFKQEAVSKVLAQGYSVSDAAISLGIREKLLYTWKKKITDNNSSASLTVDEKSELLKLRKENKLLRMEKEILKKASAFFAKEMK